MYDVFIGLEIHIQLLTNTKIFCACRTSFGEEPNTNVCPVCLGYPGTLPALNKQALFMAYKVALALHSSLSPQTLFERKNYFYPDLPKNYQISQFAKPIGIGGWIDFPYKEQSKRIRIRDVHLEEDAGKMIHTSDTSLLDFNRAGTPLLEIVTEPDLSKGEEAEAFLQYFKKMVQYLEVCDGNMEEGSLRCDANISINQPGAGLGTKVELKNMNSSKFVRLALDYEKARHQNILDKGLTLQQETRLWNENRDTTILMRVKEEAQDYRYFPEPDLPPFSPSPEYIQKISSSRPELPLDRLNRLIKQYGLTKTQIEYVCDVKTRADFFENTVHAGADPQKTVLWLAGDIAKLLKRYNTSLEQSYLTPERLANLLTLLQEGTIHGRLGKQVLQMMLTEDKGPQAIIHDHKLDTISESEQLAPIVEELLSQYPALVREIAAGEHKKLGFLIGEIMKKTSGQADPAQTKILIEQAIHEKRKELK